MPVHKVMDIDTCGHPRVTGAPTVLVATSGSGGGGSSATSGLGTST